METFNDFGLTSELLAGIEKLGFKEPTPVQAKVIPMLLNGKRDLVALAQTGTGKTAAFGLPMLQLTDTTIRAVQGLVLCPTRELCLQISKDLQAFSRFAPHIRVLPVYGGTSIMPQIHALYQGVHILVATPGRMNDLLRRGCAKLEKVERVVLDEADEMLTMGFQEEIESILKEVPKTARTLLFSATMPKEVAVIAKKYMHDAEEIILGKRNAGATGVSHEYYMVHARDRYPALKRIIDARPGFYGIVFCRTRAETQEVASLLIEDKYNADALHGDLSQGERDRVMNNFRLRNLKILVATDVASRGLDVNDLTHIINYDLPSDPEAYTHRSGRTGRAGKEGISIALVNMREMYRIKAIERFMNKRFEQKLVPTGKQVCEAQLISILETIKKADTKDKLLDVFLPKINEVLSDLSREDLIRLLVSRDFGHILAYYKNAQEINVQHHVMEQNRHDGRNNFKPKPRFEHHDNKYNKEKTREPHYDSPVRSSGNSGLAYVRINLGKKDELTAPSLISLINRSTHGHMLKLGRIRILDTASFFEIDARGAEKMLLNLNKASHHGRQIIAAIEGKGASIVRH